MREKLMPWLPAIFCGCLSLITLLAGIVGSFVAGDSSAGNIAFFSFMPICFLHVGVMLKTLRDENRDLRNRLDELMKQS
jgi:hypothetical protein